MRGPCNWERRRAGFGSQLSYRPPYDWPGILAFLAARALAGVEHVTDRSYARTVQLGKAKGWIRLTAVVSAAVRLAGHPRVPRRPGARGCRTRDGPLVCADRATGKGEGLDSAHSCRIGRRTTGRASSRSSPPGRSRVSNT